MDMASVAAVGFVVIFYLAFLVGIYVVQCYGPYRMAKHAGVPNAWLALVPVGTNYIVGLLAERAVYTYTGSKRRLAFWNALLCGGCIGLVAFIMGLAISDMDFNALVGISVLLLFILVIAVNIVFFYSLYYIYKDYAPDNAVLYTVLGILLGIYWIFLLVVMNHVPVSVTGFGAYPYGRPKYDKYGGWPQNPPQQGGYYPGAGYGPQPGGYAGQPPYRQGQTYTTQPGGYAGQAPYQQGQTYTTQPGGYAGQPPYQQGQTYTTQPGQSGGYDPSGSFPSGGYDPRNPQTYAPPQQREPKKEEHNGPEL